MDIFQNQCSESLGFDSMLSSNHLNSPLQDSPDSPNPLTFAPSSPYFSSITQQLCGSGSGGTSSGPNDVILPSIFVKIPTQINQQYQQESRLHNARNSSEIKCEERAEPIKCEVTDTRIKLTVANVSVRLPDIIDNFLNDTRGASGTAAEPCIVRCDYCPFASLSEASVGEHKRTKHVSGVRLPLDTISCPVCENKFFKKSVLELHLLEEHEMVRNEVEILCARMTNFSQQPPACGESVAVSSATQPSIPPTITSMIASAAAPNKSRIYIKDVQLLKKPDVIAQETQHQNVQQCQAQQLHPVDSQASLAPAHLRSQESVHPHAEPSHHNQYHGELHQPTPQTTANGSTSGSKIFIRNVSLLQNVNFTPSAENILLSNGGGKYHSFLNHDCQGNNSLSPAIDNASMDDGNSSSSSSTYCQMLPSTVATTMPKSNRIYIKNVDILRNPLLSLDTTQTPTNAYNVTTTSRASSCESIICTTTPPPRVPQTSTSQALPPTTVQPPTTIIPLSQIISSQPPMVSATENSSMSALGGLMTPQMHPQTGQVSISIPMMYTTGAPESSQPTDSCTSSVSSVSSCVPMLPAVSSPSSANSTHAASVGDYQIPSSASEGQRKSKIFIKNISVLKQPTIHLKSVDEVNLMTYDQLQLQNLLPVGVTSAGAGMSVSNSDHLVDGGRQQAEIDGNGQPMDQSFGDGRINDEIVDHQQTQPQQEEAMNGDYHDVGCYGDIDVCEFTDGYNDRDDPGGGAGTIVSGGFDQGFILLQSSCGSGTDTQENENDIQKMSDSWRTIEFVGGSSLPQDIPGPSSVSVLGTEGAHNAEYAHHEEHPGETQQHTKDMLFVCAQEVINLDPPNEEPKVNEDIHRGSIDDGERSVVELDESSPAEELPTVRSDRAIPERPRPRGRPKGAKQTGITKLKKLYSNLTPQEEGYKCDIKECGARFRQQDRLEYHRKCHLPEEGSTAAACEPTAGTPTIQCPECGSLEFRNWNTLHTHLWREHAIDMELYACQLCSFKTPVLCRLTNTHMKIHSEERNFKCTICSKAFKNNKQLRNHRRSHRDPAQVQTAATHAPDDTPSANGLDDPLSSSNDRGMEVDNGPIAESGGTSNSKHTKANASAAVVVPIKCVKCGQKFTSQRQLQAHMNAKHPAMDEGQDGGGGGAATGKHRCALCGMMFKTRYLLQSHSAKHTDEKRFKCEHCDYTTNDHNAFRRHKMRHNTKGNHMYKCSYCDYTSIQSTTYRKHLERMHADEASRLLYKCAKCSFVSISELKYQLHRAKHENPDEDGEPGGDGQTDNTRQPGDPEQMSFEGELPTENDAGVNRLDQLEAQPQQEDDSRACESVGSDVMIVDNREPTDTTVDTIRPNCADTGSFAITQHQHQPQQPQQQPIIRPAMFANNFSKVDNFYGHQYHQQLQPKILKLTDRIPSHRVSPLGQFTQPQPQPFNSQSLNFSSVALAGSAIPATTAIPLQELAGIDYEMESFDMQQQQQQYEHQQQTFLGTVGDTSMLGRN